MTRSQLPARAGMHVTDLAVRGHSLAADVAPELPPGTYIPDAARPGPDFDVEKATQAYLAMLSPEQRARSDAYFEGGYWLQLWQFLYTIAVLALVLWRGWAVKLRDWAGRISKGPARRPRCTPSCMSR